MAVEAFSQLTPDHCVVLSSYYAAEPNLDALTLLLADRRDAFDAETALQIILTYLPETLEPDLYTPLVARLIGSSEAGTDLPSITADSEPVKDWPDFRAFEERKNLRLLPLDHPSCPASLCDDLAARFLIHRTHRIAEVGMMTHIPPLLHPFLDDRPFLRTYFISNVLPMLRFCYEYYPEEDVTWTLDQLSMASAQQALEFLLPKSLVNNQSEPAQSALARDLECMVGPWMYGACDRKRRKLNGRRQRQRSIAEYSTDSRRYGNELEDDFTVEEKRADAQAQWDHAFLWMTKAAASNFPAVALAIEAWDGPSKLDLGSYQSRAYLDDELEGSLEMKYAQTAFAAVYAADLATREAITCAHGILVRLASLMDFEPPPDLATSVDMLPKIDDQKSILSEMTSHALHPDALLATKHPLTHPATDTFALLQLLVFSSYMLLELHYPLSIVATAKIRFQFDADEQLGIITRILHSPATKAKRDDDAWIGVRARIIWLWGWSFPKDEGSLNLLGHGIFGNIERGHLEKELLKAYLEAEQYDLVTKIYLRDAATSSSRAESTLTDRDIEQVILSAVLQHYDNASNGNRNRGGIKKASEIVAAFRKHFSDSVAFRCTEALLAATHSLSFYSLKLQHNVPFRPVNIRVSSDPVSLIEKLLSQNPQSYTRLDDLLSIAINLVASGVGQEVEDGIPMRSMSQAELARAKRKAEHRVIGMAIEAALHEDDFETAYSYVMNRLDKSTASSQGGVQELDDISWRAALAAGRHKTNPGKSTASSSSSIPPKLRRLEQRMELLAQTLLLAPPNAVPEVLNVWRKCEEEMSSLQAAESAEENAFNQRAEQGLPGAFIETSLPAQPRREVGRGAVEEAPIGLFDVARGAAAAFSRTAFPLRGAAVNTTSTTESVELARPASALSETAFSDGEEQQRVRRRDMISSAATGALASGIGWVIGASPADRQAK